MQQLLYLIEIVAEWREIWRWAMQRSERDTG